MAVLSNADRADVWAQWMRDNTQPIDVTKQELRAAFNAIDDWVETNSATLNLAIPQPARTRLTAAQKARILMAVVQRRFVRS